MKKQFYFRNEHTLNIFFLESINTFFIFSQLCIDPVTGLVCYASPHGMYVCGAHYDATSENTFF